ncbi:hypothetical protein AAFF_G00378710 [Aldrovandia affinis]|uniref:Uncharacterized protein n=1 Tax=Aldrovandia affinis TaxID=143900 RepID=A0AAD7SFK5_9TELE|nr:hypothetical protein AAFF_G00378710 [Aldrovandia affinis]
MENENKIFLQLLFLLNSAWYANCRESRVTQDGELVPITCDLKNPSKVIWFHLGKTGMDFIGFVYKGVVTYTRNITSKDTGFDIMSKERMEIKFNKERYIGIYGCSTISDNKLIFGNTITLVGSPDPITTISPRHNPHSTKYHNNPLYVQNGEEDRFSR